MPVIMANKNDSLAAEIIRKQMDLVLDEHKDITEALDDAERQIRHKVRR